MSMLEHRLAPQRWFHFQTLLCGFLPRCVAFQVGHPLLSEATWSPALHKQCRWLYTRRWVMLPWAALAVETVSMNLLEWGHGALAGEKQGDLCGQSVTTTALRRSPDSHPSLLMCLPEEDELPSLRSTAWLRGDRQDPPGHRNPHRCC